MWFEFLRQIPFVNIAIVRYQWYLYWASEFRIGRKIPQPPVAPLWPLGIACRTNVIITFWSSLLHLENHISSSSFVISFFAQADRRPDPFEDTANTSKGAEASYSYLRFLINDLVPVFNGVHDVHGDRVDHEADVDHGDDVFEDVAHSCTRFPCYLGMEINAETQWTTTKIVKLGN